MMMTQLLLSSSVLRLSTYICVCMYVSYVCMNVPSFYFISIQSIKITTTHLATTYTNCCVRLSCTYASHMLRRR